MLLLWLWRRYKWRWLRWFCGRNKSKYQQKRIITSSRDYCINKGWIKIYLCNFKFNNLWGKQWKITDFLVCEAYLKLLMSYYNLQFKGNYKNEPTIYNNKIDEKWNLYTWQKRIKNKKLDVRYNNMYMEYSSTHICPFMLPLRKVHLFQ